MKCETCEYLHICRHMQRVRDFYLSSVNEMITDESAHTVYTNAVFKLLDLCGHYKEKKNV